MRGKAALHWCAPLHTTESFMKVAWFQRILTRQNLLDTRFYLNGCRVAVVQRMCVVFCCPWHVRSQRANAQLPCLTDRQRSVRLWSERGGRPAEQQGGPEGVVRQGDGSAGSDGEDGLQHGAGERAEEVRRPATRWDTPTGPNTFCPSMLPSWPMLSRSGWEGPAPPRGCEVFVGKVPRDMYEDELVPLFESAGRIYEFRLMMEFSGENRGYAFVMYTSRWSAQNRAGRRSPRTTRQWLLCSSREEAVRAIQMLDGYEVRPGRFIGVCVSLDNCRLFIGSIPRDRRKEEILEEMRKVRWLHQDRPLKCMLLLWKPTYNSKIMYTIMGSISLFSL